MNEQKYLEDIDSLIVLWRDKLITEEEDFDKLVAFNHIQAYEELRLRQFGEKLLPHDNEYRAFVVDYVNQQDR